MAELLELLNDTWTERFGYSKAQEHDPRDALFGYDTMWLGALALDLAETKLQNMTPSLTLGDFQYTGENSTVIKNAIYSSGLEVTFTGSSVSDRTYVSHGTYCHSYCNSTSSHTCIPYALYTL